MQGAAEGIQMKGQLMLNERRHKERRRLRTERVYSQMGSSAVQKSLIANLVQSSCRPPVPGAVPSITGLRALHQVPQGPALDATSVLDFSL